MTERREIKLADDGESVPLQHAFAWDCPSCGAENFQRAPAVVMSREASAELLRKRGELDCWQELPESERIVATRAPDSVTCRVCEEMFPVFDAIEGEVGGEDRGEEGEEPGDGAA